MNINEKKITFFNFFQYILGKCVCPEGVEVEWPLFSEKRNFYGCFRHYARFYPISQIKIIHSGKKLEIVFTH